MLLEGGRRDEGEKRRLTVVFYAGIVGESVEMGFLEDAIRIHSVYLGQEASIEANL